MRACLYFNDESPIGQTTLCLCVITVSLPTEIVFRSYRTIFAAKITALAPLV